MFQVVSNFYNRDIITSLSLSEFINSMKNPDFIKKSQVDLARKTYGNSPLRKNDPLYKSIKGSLPCITFLNSFKNSVKNENIVSNTGFMYLDIDNTNSINIKSNNFVVAYWKSLSNNGYGILIKCTNTSENLQDNIKELSEILDIKLDNNAVSKDRLNVMGYDNDIYYNPNYTNYDFSNKEKVSFSNTIKSINRLRVNDTTYEQDIGKLRFSNLEEVNNNYDFKGKDYITLKDKIYYAEVFVPKNIFEGNRNKSMFVLCSQVRGLNIWLTQESLFRVCSAINIDKFKPKLTHLELNDIVKKVYENKNPIVILNKTRRFLTNPKSKLSKEQKKSIQYTEMGLFRKEKADYKINECIANWDIKVNGKITFSKIAIKTLLGLATVKRRSTEIKSKIDKINE